MSRHDERGRANDRWLESLSNAREHTRENLADADALITDPGREILPAKPVSKLGEATSTHLRLHICVLDYHDQLAAYSRKIGGLWTDELCDVYVRGREDPVTVSLSSLDEDWRMEYLTYEEEVEKPREGEVMQTKRYRLVLPIRAASLLYSQLNKCVEDLGLAAEITEQDVEAEPF